MTLKAGHIAELIGWGAACYGVVQVAEREGAFGDASICGPWGCGPPLPAVIAMHGFWLIVAAGVVRLAALFLPARWLRHVGRALTVIGLLGAIGLAGWGVSEWWAEVATDRRQYAGRRLLFELAAHTDLPVLQATLAGATAWIVGRVRLRRRAYLPAPHCSKMEECP
ncbi:MAG: hypothetical protein AAF907_03750, partial [Planctomycetota bacterium]